MRPFPEVPGVEHRFVEAGGVRLHVAEAGPADAPPVLLVHGWPQHWYCWRRLIPLLSGEARLIAVDLRGFGWSDAPAGDYAKETLAGDVLALLDALEVERAHVVGHDWGGFVSFLLALRAPERVRSLLALAIVHPWAKLEPSPKRIPRTLYQVALALPVGGALIQRYTPFVDAVFRLSGGDRIWSPAEREEFVASFRPADHAAAASALYRTFLLRELRQLQTGRYADRRLTVPARLVLGRADPVIRPDLVAGWEPHADAMRVESIDGGHFLPEEAPDAVAGQARALWAG